MLLFSILFSIESLNQLIWAYYQAKFIDDFIQIFSTDSTTFLLVWCLISLVSGLFGFFIHKRIVYRNDKSV